MAKQVIHGEESRAAILRGVNELANAVKVSVKVMPSRNRYGSERMMTSKSKFENIDRLSA